MKFEHTLGLFRHANAVASDDELNRPLTPEGEDWANQVSRKDIEWQHVITSHATRAIQTGYLISGMNVEQNELLYVAGDPRQDQVAAVLALVQERLSQGNLLVVTHQPLMRPLLEKLCPEFASVDISSGEGVLISPSKTELVTKNKGKTSS